MSENETNLFCSIFTHPFLGLAFTRQIVFNESCISIKILLAPINKVITNIPQPCPFCLKTQGL
jgi:hypothetical protein